jgi:uncharacterized iron-regulated membrane protein
MKKIFKIHSWLGLFNGVWLLLLGLSGSLLVYYVEIDRYINSDILCVEKTGERLSVDTLYKIVRSRHPDASGTNITFFPKTENDCYSFRLYDNAKIKSNYYSWDLYQVDINPYTGEIVREGYYRDFVSFLHWLHTFHYSLQMGTPGMLIVTIAGILLFINILTGVIIYRKYILKALIFRAPVQWKNWRTGTSGLHRYIGVWSLLFNIVIFYSGLQMNWTVFDKQTWATPQAQPKNTQPYANIDDIIRKTDSIFPGFKIEYFYIPYNTQFDGYINEADIIASGHLPNASGIFPTSASYVAFKANSGQVTRIYNITEESKKMNAIEKWNAIAYTFHVGSFWGEFSRVLYIFVGLSPGILSITGFMLWLRRKKRQK